MKGQLTEQQLVRYSLDQLRGVLHKVPFVSDIETRMTGVERGFGDFWLTIHFIDNMEPIELRVAVESRGEKRFALSLLLNVPM